MAGVDEADRRRSEDRLLRHRQRPASVVIVGATDVGRVRAYRRSHTAISSLVQTHTARLLLCGLSIS